MKKGNGWELLPAVQTARIVLFCCFFLSGLTGLLYEVVWVRMFALVFGNTVYSTAAVLAAFMGGLGAGGWWFGRFIEKRKDAILFYGIVETVIGIYALVPALLIHLLESQYPSIYQAASGNLSLLVSVKVLASIIILVIPTFCMGATLPLLSGFFVSQRTRFGSAVSLLYGLNTLGAVTGTFLTGFILLPVMGIRSTLLMGMIINIGIGLMAIVQHGKLSGIDKDTEDSPQHESSSPSEADVAEDEDAAPLTGSSTRGFFIPLVLIGTFIAGFVSLLLEIAWTRELALVLGSSVYSFTLILFTFLLGIALGSLILGRYLRKHPGAVRRHGLALLGICFLGIAVFSSAGLPLIQYVLFYFGKFLGMVQADYRIVLFLQFAACVAMLIIPALFFGAAFPAAAALYSMRTRAVSSGVGRVYLWNTVGAILGSSLTGFAFIPLMGVHASIVTGTLSALAIGIVLIFAEISMPVLRRTVVSAATGALVVFIVATSAWDSMLMTSGPFIYGANFAVEKNLASLKKNYADLTAKLLYQKDGVSCSVSVLQRGSVMYLRVNGKTDASTSGDAHSQTFASAMPLLVHPNPQRVAVIGMGSGMSAGTALLFPSVKSMDVIEIEPYIVEAAKFFDKYNFHLLSDPRAHVHIEDARNYFLGHEDKYDVIVSEPSNHWIAGIANLYTQDFYRLTSKRLNPGGIYCQWIQFYFMAPESLRMILATYQSVYPYVHAFNVMSDLFLVGSQTPFDIDGRVIASRFNAINLEDRFKSIGLTFNGYGITAAHYVAGPQEIQRLSAMSPLHTDDHPYLEFNAPYERFEKSDRLYNMMTGIFPVDVFSRINLADAKLTADDYYNIARETFIVQVQAPSSGEEFLKKAIAIDPNHVKSLEQLARYYDKNALPLLADHYYKLALDKGSGPAFRLGYAAFLAKQKNFEDADRIIRPLLGPDYKGNRAQLDELYAFVSEGIGFYERAAGYYLEAARLTDNLKDRSLKYAFAAAALKKVSPANPQQRLGILVEANKLWPENPQIAYELASIFMQSGDLDQAQRVLIPAYNSDPRITDINILLWEIEKLKGKNGGT